MQLEKLIFLNEDFTRFRDLNIPPWTKFFSTRLFQTSLGTIWSYYSKQCLGMSFEVLMLKKGFNSKITCFTQYKLVIFFISNFNWLTSFLFCWFTDSLNLERQLLLSFGWQFLSINVYHWKDMLGLLLNSVKLFLY